MNADFGFIVQALSRHTLEHIQIYNRNAAVSAVKFLSESQPIFEPEILYIGYSSTVNISLPLPNTANIICIGGFPADCLDMPKLNIAEAL